MKVNNKEQMDKLSNQGSVFMNVPKGTTTIRVIGDIHAVREHEIKVEGKHRGIACPTEQARMEIKAGVRQDLDVPPCPLCELGYPVKTKYLSVVVEREYEKDGKFYGGEAWVLKKGSTLLGEIQNLLEDPNWGAAGDYDIKITATGDGLARKYSIMAIPKDKSPELTKREQMSLAELSEKVSLDQMTTPRTYAEIKKIIGEDFPDFETAKTNDVPF